MVEKLELIPLKDISPNPYQPRLEFNQEELDELAKSIKENGLIQPIIVRPSSIFGYELIAGERRLRASERAGLELIPAVIKDVSNRESMQQAIVENLQRSNLNPIEEAKAYQQLLDKNQMTHEELATYMGKSRPYITNSLRLLNLPTFLIRSIENGSLSQGHARLLLTIPDEEKQNYWFQRISNENLSVRQLEKLLKEKPKIKSKSKKINIFIKDKESELSKAFGLPVTISQKKDGQGQLVFHFSDDEDFNRIINKLK